MAWISVHEQVMGGKLHRFAKRAGCSKKEALGILVGMWLWGINNADAVGRLDEMDKSDVADAISSGLSEGLVPSKIVDAMLDIGFLDMDGDTLYIHDWEIWQKQWYDFQTKKRKDADRKRVERHRKRFEEEALANGQERPAGGDKKEFAPHVLLTQQQFDSLAEEYGTMAANKFVYVLDEYKGRTNKVYHDDYSAILKWVVEKVSKEDPAAIQKKQVGGSKFSIPEVEF